MNELTDLKNEYKYIYDTLCCVMRMPQNKKSSINSIFKYGHPVRKDGHPVQKNCFFGFTASRFPYVILSPNLVVVETS